MNSSLDTSWHGSSGKSAEASAVGYFGVTAWSTVLEANGSDEENRKTALDRLFHRYRTPIVREIQTRRRCHEATAEDLAHDFIAVCLHRDFLRNLSPQQGRFRSFIHRCLTNFLNDEHARRNALKRGGGEPVISLDETDGDGGLRVELAGDGPSASETMDRAWAGQIVQEALARLEQECEAARRGALFAALKSRLGRATNDSNLAEIAAQLRMSEGAIKVALHRMRQRLGELVAEEIKQTVTNQMEWRQELKYLLDLLGREAV
jgi:RNA polymerase sigma factor (sigma-70 family)